MAKTSSQSFESTWLCAFLQHMAVFKFPSNYNQLFRDIPTNEQPSKGCWTPGLHLCLRRIQRPSSMSSTCTTFPSFIAGMTSSMNFFIEVVAITDKKSFIVLQHCIKQLIPNIFEIDVDTFRKAPRKEIIWFQQTWNLSFAE